MIGAGVGSLAGGYISEEKLGGSYELGAFVGNLVGGVAGSAAYSKISSLSMPDKGYDSFNELKKELGPAGDGKAWHHIVEQSQITKSGFEPRQVHNVRNIVSIPNGKGSIHSQISGYYSSKQIFTNGVSVRNWLTGKDFKTQFEFGFDYLQKHGTMTPSSTGWIFKPF